MLTHHAGASGAELSGWAAAELGSLGWSPDGLYVATSTAGHRESVGFWTAAQETGLIYANPRLFPWTLVNGPTGSIAIALGVRGPTYTLVGYAEAVLGALECAADDLRAGAVSRPLVVALDVVDGECRLAAVTPTSVLGIGKLAMMVRLEPARRRPAHVLRAAARSMVAAGATPVRRDDRSALAGRR